MLGAFRPGPAMHLLVTILGIPALLVLTASSAGLPAPAVADVNPGPACFVAATRPAAGAEPPAWLLLAGAVVLLGAGRMAASDPRATLRWRRTAGRYVRHR